MPLASIRAVYDGYVLRPLEPVPVDTPYLVLVTFLEPAPGGVVPGNGDLTRFWDSFNAWRDLRPIEDTLRDIHEARVSKPEPPPRL